jgi:hypothetical protein
MEDTATMRDLGQAVGSLGLSAGINFLTLRLSAD